MAARLHNLLNRVKKQLRCRKSLLPINNRPRLNLSGSKVLLLNDYGTQKVGPRLVNRLSSTSLWIAKGIFNVRFSCIANIIPERLPLILLLPYIWTLKSRDLIANSLAE